MQSGVLSVDNFSVEESNKTLTNFSKGPTGQRVQKPSGQDVKRGDENCM